MKETEKDNDLTARVIGYCFKLHNDIGPGYIEKVYHNGLTVLFKKENIIFESEKQFKLRLNLWKEVFQRFSTDRQSHI